MTTKKKSQELIDAEKALAEFLEKHPRAQEPQRQLMEELDRVSKDPEIRLQLILDKMSTNFNKINQIKALVIELKQQIDSVEMEITMDKKCNVPDFDSGVN